MAIDKFPPSFKNGTSFVACGSLWMPFLQLSKMWECMEELYWDVMLEQNGTIIIPFLTTVFDCLIRGFSVLCCRVAPEC